MLLFLKNIFLHYSSSKTVFNQEEREHFSKTFCVYISIWHATQKGSWDSSVSIVSDYGLNDQAAEVRFPTEAKGFFL
jgi:hypothetical protein